MRMTFKDYNDMWEDAAANAVGHGGVSMPADAMPLDKIKRHKKRVQKSMYDGRTKEGKKFIERILARRNAREALKSSLPESAEDVSEIKKSDLWQEYGRLLGMKSDLIKKQKKPNASLIVAINKKINAVLKQLDVVNAEVEHEEVIS